MKLERIIIVGGGVGGLALASALTKLALPFVVLERAPKIRDAGSALGILPGAVRALETLDIGDELFSSGSPFQRFVVSTSGGTDLAEVSFTRIFERAGRLGYVLRHGALHSALMAQVDPASVRTGAEVTAIENGEDRVRVWVKGDSTPVEGSLLVGADGLRSVVRMNVLADGPPRYVGETIFRGISHYRLKQPEISKEFFGAGSRAAYYQLSEGRVYWWATAPFPEKTRVVQGERRALLEEAFTGWAHPLPELLAATPTDCILQNDIFDRRHAKRWHRGRAVLLGDAAHPTTPNLGQGACMAIEDAIVLARNLVEKESADEAFGGFYRARSRRTARTVRMSRWWGKAGLWKNPALVALRNRVIDLQPEGWMERRGAAQYCHDPGSLSGAARVPSDVHTSIL